MRDATDPLEQSTGDASPNRGVSGSLGVASPRSGLHLRSSQDDRQFLDYVYLACKEGRDFAFSDEMLEKAGCSFIGVDEMARVVLKAMSLQHQGAFNVSGGFCTSVELIDTFNRLVGTDETMTVVSENEGESLIRLPQSRTELEVSAFAAATGFRPTSNIDELVGLFLDAEGVSS